MTEKWLRVLLAEDDDAVRKTIAAYLREQGVEVDEASDGNKALQLLAEVRFDAVLTDIRMPYADGWSVAAQARALNDTIPVIYASGCEEADDRCVIGSVFIQKPASLAMILGALRGMARSQPITAEHAQC